MTDYDAIEYPGDAPSEGVVVSVAYSTSWFPIVAGVLNRLRHEAWNDAPSTLNDEIDDLIYRLTTEVSGMAYPNNAFLTPPQAHIDTGTALSLFANTSALFDFLCYRSTPGQFDQMTWKCLLKAGSYKARFIWHKTSAGGIATITIGGNQVEAGLDTYSGSTVYNQITDYSFTVSADGEISIVLSVDSKNASSSGYRFPHTAIIIMPQ